MKTSSFKLYQVLIVPFALMVSFVIAITAYFTWHYSESFAMSSGEHINKQTVTSIETEIDYYFHHAALENNGLKRVINHELLDIYDYQSTFNYMHEILDPEITKGIVDNLHIGYPNGDYLGAENSDNGILKRVANESTGHTFEVINPKKNKILEQKENYYVQQTDWYREAKASDVPIWSNVYPIFGTHQLGMTLSESVYNQQGEFVCVVGSDILLNEFNKHINELTPTDNAYLFILDKQHNIIAQSGSDNYPTEKQLSTVQESDNVLLKQAFQYFSQPNKDQTVFEISEFTVDGNTEKYLVSYIPYGRQYGLDWHIGVIVPESDLFGHVRTVELTTFGIWLIAFIICVGIGLLISSFINYSIQHLSNKVHDIKKTGSMFEHSDSSISEVNDLSVAFSQMSHQVLELFLDLKKTNERLKKAAEGKTNELQVANDQLQMLSKTDKLTQFLNRHGLEALMQRYWMDLQTSAITSLTCIVIYLDYFKQHNDSYGNVVSDDDLLTVSSLISDLVVEKGQVVRLGGEEFVITVPDMSLESSEELARRFLVKLAEMSTPDETSSMTNHVTASLGIHRINKDTMSTHDQLIQQADLAMYQAKQQGKNQYIVSESAYKN